MNKNFVKSCDLVDKSYFPFFMFNGKKADSAAIIRAYLSYVLRQDLNSSCQGHPLKSAIIVNDNSICYGQNNPPVPGCHGKQRYQKEWRRIRSQNYDWGSKG